MRDSNKKALAAMLTAALGVGIIPMASTSAAAAAAVPLTIDYAVDAGEERHVGGGNLHPFDDRGPAQWLTDGIGITAVRGQDFSRRENIYNEYLPGWFEDATHDRLMGINPDAKLMIGSYYGFKGKVARGEYGGNTDWRQLALIDNGAAYKEYIAGRLADAEAKGVDVHSWVLWNEPDLQWTDRASYFAAHENAYDGFRAADPTQKVQAPELATFNFGYLTEFLSYCKQNDCIPDILTWHELSRDRIAIEEHTTQITAWLKANDIAVMPFGITEYQGSGYSTTEAGRRDQGNYNPGLSVSYLGELERASESSTLEFGLRSQWGLPGGDPQARGYLGEMATLDDNGKMATGIWHVYNAYWDMTGRKVGTTHDKRMIDAVATYDSDPHVNQSGVLVGNWQSDAKSVPITLENIPANLVIEGRVHVQAELIKETLATPSYGTIPVISRNVAVTEGRASFTIDLDGRTAAKIVITPPSAAPTRYSPVAGVDAEKVEVFTTGAIASSTKTHGADLFAAYTGGVASTYLKRDGSETAEETGDSVTYKVDVSDGSVYNLRTRFLESPSGAFLQLYVDGESTGSPTDLYAAETQAVQQDHGNVYLAPGTHELTYKIVGAGKNTASSGYDINIGDVSLARPGVSSTTEHSVRFFRNDGSEDEYAVVLAASGERIGTLPSAPERADHEFLGWNTAADGSGSTITADTIVDADLTVWAQWRQLGELVYFVDAGDIDPTTVSPGAALGTHNSVTEQFFGPDPGTGKQWGLLDTPAPSVNYPDLLTGAGTWPAENLSYTDATPAAQTYRYARQQTQPIDERLGIPYKFELEDGEYRVRMSIATGWPSQADRGYKAMVTFNEGTATEVAALAPTVLSKDWTAPVEVDAVATVSGGYLTINVDMADTASNSVVVNQIEIRRVLADVPELDIDVAVDTRCTAGRNQLIVRTLNAEDIPVSLKYESDFGTKSFTTVKPDKRVFHPFATRLAELPAGEVTVTASSVIDGRAVSTTETLEYAGNVCG